jgi:hypothetical protein
VAKPVTSTLSVTQNRADFGQCSPNTKIKATIKTYLKKQPIDSSQLGENEKKKFLWVQSIKSSSIHKNLMDIASLN